MAMTIAVTVTMSVTMTMARLLPEASGHLSFPMPERSVPIGTTIRTTILIRLRIIRIRIRIRIIVTIL